MTTQKTQTASSTPRVSTAHLPAPRGYYFDEQEAERAEQFFSLLVHTKGKWAGTQFNLLGWQSQEFIRPLFGWKRPDGTRRFRTAYEEVPSKNGKSEKAAGIALKLTRADRELGAEVYAAAGDKDQGRIIFETAKAMVEGSPQLRRKARILRDAIVWESAVSGSVFRVVSADAPGKYGLNVHGLVFDELWVQPNRELWDALNEMTGSREQPLTVALTTAGIFDPTSICWEQHDYAERVAQGLVEDPHYLGVIYGAEPEDDWRVPETWRKANPSLGVTKSEEYMAERAKRAANQPSYLNTFLRLHLGIWTKQLTRWIPVERWDETADLIKPGALKARTCVGGLHLVASTDITAWMLLFPAEDGYEVLGRFFVPEARMANLDERTSGQASAWAREGFLTVTPGDTTDYEAITTQVSKDAQTFDIQEIAYHRFGATQLANQLQDAGLEITPVTTGMAHLSPATKEFERRIMNKGFRHGGNPVLRWMVSNMAAKQDGDGNLKIDSQRSADTVVGPVALVMALSRAMLQETGPSVYEERGLVTL